MAPGKAEPLKEVSITSPKTAPLNGDQVVKYMQHL